MLNSTIYGFSRDTYFFLEIMMVKKKIYTKLHKSWKASIENETSPL